LQRKSRLKRKRKKKVRPRKRRKECQSKLTGKDRVRTEYVFLRRKQFESNNLKVLQYQKSYFYNSESERISLQRLINLNSQEFQYD